ncbi:MAG: signal peptidase I [Acidimicrobiales bacterium]
MAGGNGHADQLGGDGVDLVARYGDSAERARPPSDWLTPPTVDRRLPAAALDDAEPDDEFEELDYEDYFDEDEGFDVDTSATRNALEWAVVLVGAVLVALLLRASLFQAFWIPSESMETTLLIDDRVLVNKLSYRLHEVRRGDVVVFIRPDDEPGEIRDLIKRVIAVGGETVEAHDNSIYINDKRLIEPYLDEGIETSDFGPIVVPEGEVFVMGDNRSQSYDSRLFGTVDEDRIVGRAFVLFWPPNRVGSL